MRLAKVALLPVATLLVVACGGSGSTASCADPVPVTSAGQDMQTGASDLHLWQPDGDREPLPVDRPGWGPVLSPDGRSVAFVRLEGEYTDTLGIDRSRVAVVSLESGNVDFLTPNVPGIRGYDLQWSADGTEIAFSRTTGETLEIAAVGGADGVQRTLVPSAENYHGSFSWSSESDEVLLIDLVAPEELTPLRRYSVDTGD